jgi:DNA mismatch repair ATPase MutS
MTSSAVMDIRDGRHLLYAHRMGEKFVPNSTVLGSGHGQDAGSNGGSSAQSDASGDGGRGNIQIITGPNMSGQLQSMRAHDRGCFLIR